VENNRLIRRLILIFFWGGAVGLVNFTSTAQFITVRTEAGTESFVTSAEWCVAFGGLRALNTEPLIGCISLAYINNTLNDIYGGYTGCPRRNVPDFGRVFLMLKYTDITQNIHVQS